MTELTRLGLLPADIDIAALLFSAKAELEHLRFDLLRPLACALRSGAKMIVKGYQRGGAKVRALHLLGRSILGPLSRYG